MPSAPVLMPTFMHTPGKFHIEVPCSLLITQEAGYGRRVQIYFISSKSRSTSNYS